MASNSKPKAHEPESVSVTSVEFCADSRPAIREALSGKTVAVTGSDGKTRAFILKQTEPLEA
ncbi:hypothetical protein JYT86_00685 [bacterium AH-315-N03]|nr:hypothetical protein [bacterium AH-315-N03]